MGATGRTQQDWWNARPFLTLAVFASTIPLLWPGIPPLNDLPGHLGRYHLMTVLGDGGPLDNGFRIDWSLIGNLGVDLPVYALAPLIGVEAAAKLIVLLIPPLFLTGLIALSRAVHGRVHAPIILAFLLAYSFPFQLGFVNYCLSVALATLALALWIRLASRRAMRIALFVPIAGVIWVTHSFGWALLGLMCGGAELVMRRERGEGWTTALIGTAAACLPMAWPVLLMLGGGGKLAGETGEWLNPSIKAQWIVSLLRERWKWWDLACATVMLSVLYGLARSKHWRFDPVLGLPALLCGVAFILLPWRFQGGAYVDMRILPQAVALALVALAPRDAGSGESRLASGLAVFAALRLAATAAAMLLFARTQTDELAALAAIPRGGSLLVLVQEPCGSDWSGDRLGVIGGIAIARRDVFTNTQWSFPGQQLITPIRAGAAPFAADPSQLMFPVGCAYRPNDYDRTMAAFDRSAFDHVWTIGFPPSRNRQPDLKRVWTNGRSTVYRVAR